MTVVIPLVLPSNAPETKIDPIWSITFPRNPKDRPMIPSNRFCPSVGVQSFRIVISW